MIGLAIVVGAGGMIFSLTDTVTSMFDKTLGSDYLLIPPSVAIWKGDVGASETLKGKLSSIPGVSGQFAAIRSIVNSIRLAEDRHERCSDFRIRH